jgi:RHH-type proline utilization regulon transcriptional repressor/proline dehydrogenase/delta 1-pyrroline-5-carboxylate dehydrogenase
VTFRNEPLLDLRHRGVRERLAASLAALDAELPRPVPVIVAGERRDEPGFGSFDPGEPERRVADATPATEADVDAAVAAAGSVAGTWGSLPAAERAAVLSRAAEHLRQRREAIAALAVRECAKPWPEADADVAEAIDFLEYYGARAVELEGSGSLIQIPGERNEMRYVPRGVVAVVAPWNFPVAIATGMTAAGLATGNGVVLKPAEQSPACGLAIVEALLDAGLPPAAISLLPGLGDVGAALVSHPGVHTVAFTGSGAVGVGIMRVAARVGDGQSHLKRVVAEMGGKNCMIVDADADLDEILPAIIRSAFAFAGQKCSATSRLLVHERVLGELVERLSGAMETLQVDRAERFGVDVPPLIDREARDRVSGYVEVARNEGAELIQGVAGPAGAGWFVAPTLAVGVPPGSRVLREEVFGPLLAVEEVAGVDEACDIVAGQPFGLTCGLFSRNPATVERVVARSPVGNLYVNRPTTGAMVGRQPFGGNRLSGTGAKAGGPDYLLQFVDSRVVSESTARHGLVI